MTLEEKYEAANAGWKSCIEDLRKAGEMHAALEVENEQLKERNNLLYASIGTYDHRVGVDFFDQLQAAAQRNRNLEEALKALRGLFDEPLNCYLQKSGKPITNGDQDIIDAAFIKADAALTPPHLVGFVSFPHPELDGNPACAVCGAVMVPAPSPTPQKLWICMSCGSSDADLRTTEERNKG